jgi:glycine cleavage system H protein
VVVAVNPELSGAPEQLNADPYGDGWICEIEVADPGTIDTLLDPGAYRALTEA